MKTNETTMPTGPADPAPHRSFTVAQLLAILAEANRRHDGTGSSERHLVSFLSDVIDELGKGHASKNMAVEHPPPAPARAHVIIRRDFMRKITLATVAREVSVSAKTLDRQYRRRWGLSLAADLHRVRLVRATELLCHSDLKIEAVALEVGLKSKKDLYRIVREHYRVTPGELRRRTIESSQTASTNEDRRAEE